MNNKLDEIKHHAARLMAEKGFEAMSLRKLAAAAGVCPGSVYAHYESKGQLLLSMYCDYLEGLMSAWLQQRKQRRKTQCPEQLLRRFVAVYVAFYYAKAEQSLTVQLDYRSLDEQGRALVNQLKGRYEAELASILRQGMLKDVFSIRDAGSVQLAILCVLQGFCAAGCSAAAPVAETLTLDACMTSVFRLVGVAPSMHPIS